MSQQKKNTLSNYTPNLCFQMLSAAADVKNEYLWSKGLKTQCDQTNIIIIKLQTISTATIVRRF